MKTRFVVDTQKLFTLDECPATPTDSANERYTIDQVMKLSGAFEGGQAAGEEARPTLVLYDAGLGMITDSLAHHVIDAVKVAGVERKGYERICAGTAGSRGRLARLHDTDLLVATERAVRIAMRDHEQGVSALAYRVLTDFRGKSLLTPLGRKGLLAFDSRETAEAGGAWEGRLRSEYLSSPVNGTIDRLGAEEALLAIAAGMLAGGANLQQAAYVALAGSILEGRQLGHIPLDGHELRQSLEHRPELG
jgi:hypothetical protein